MRSHIQWYIPQEENVYYEINNTYKVNKNNKFINWIINLLLKKKVIEKYIKKDVCYKSITYNYDKIGEAIRDLNNIIYRYTGSEPIKVMIGRKQAGILENEIFDTCRFNMPPFYSNGINGKKYIEELEIIVNPFIDGIVLLNEEMF